MIDTKTAQDILQTVVDRQIAGSLAGDFCSTWNRAIDDLYEDADLIIDGSNFSKTVKYMDHDVMICLFQTAPKTWKVTVKNFLDEEE